MLQRLVKVLLLVEAVALFLLPLRLLLVVLNRLLDQLRLRLGLLLLLWLRRHGRVHVVHAHLGLLGLLGLLLERGRGVAVGIGTDVNAKEYF